jgi:hypothetical protein
MSFTSVYLRYEVACVYQSNKFAVVVPVLHYIEYVFVHLAIAVVYIISALLTVSDFEQVHHALQFTWLVHLAHVHELGFVLEYVNKE